MNTRKIIAAAALLFACITADATTRVIAHRGYWTAQGSAQNSITALTKAHEIGVYGSEFDVSITSDGVAVVNHDADINGIKIETARYADIKDQKLKNGETLPTLKDYLVTARKCIGTRLILEIKPHDTEADEDRCIAEVIRLVDSVKVAYQVEYISFSLHVCKELVKKLPRAQVSYLNGDLTPSEVHALGITGIDYEGKVLKAHPEWITEAHNLGMPVNVWTVNKTDDIKAFTESGVDFITTNNPVEAMQLTR